MDGIKIICQPMQSYEAAVLKLSDETLQNVQLFDDNAVHATNRVSGNINLSEAKLLVLAIPYSDGWSAYVDGEPQKILRANTMFCALSLEAGEHEITLRYRTPGLLLGTLVSFLGVLIFAGCLMYQRRFKLSIVSDRG